MGRISPKRQRDLERAFRRYHDRRSRKRAPKTPERESQKRQMDGPTAREGSTEKSGEGGR